MKTIWITAVNGFIGSEFYRYFQGKYNILATSIEQVDLCSKTQVENFIEEHSDIDVILHTGGIGGRGKVDDTIDVLIENLQMFRNLFKAIEDRNIMLLNFGSGAEFDKSEAIFDTSEEEVRNKNPKDYYGLAKNIITREILRCNGRLSGPSCVYNIRLFGCFGALEKSDRLIRGTVEKILSGQKEIQIDDRCMSYIYVKDLCQIVDKYIECWLFDSGKLCYCDMNVVYEKPTSIVDIVKMISKTLKVKVKISLGSYFQAPYFGRGIRMKDFAKRNNIELIGLEKGIEETVKELQNV